MKMIREIKNLYKEINSFKKWAAKHYPQCDEEHDNGEWEFGVNSHFDEMVGEAEAVISKVNHEDADEELIDALLFVVARDNECENLADELIKHEGWFELLATRSMGSKYINAQWQFAKRVGEVECCKNLVYEFIDSENEYTSRMALQTLADIDSEKAEEYAELMWNRRKYAEGSYEDEYQKIMALHVLHAIKSKKLEEYLDKAMESSYVYLKDNAEGIRKQL